VLAAWRVCPLTEQVRPSAPGSPTSSAVTNHGPIGVNVSKDFRRDLSSPPRMVMSSRHV
jgi:hypothetical protein